MRCALALRGALGFLGFLGVGLLAIPGAAHSADWGRFRGPNGAGVAEATKLPAEVSPDRNVVWKVPLPPGYSSPIIDEDRIYLTAFEGDTLLTLCLNRADGKVLWRRGAPRDRVEPLDKRNGPASPSAATDGKSVFVFFGDFGLVSYTRSGEERWRRPLGPFHNIYGMGASPIVVDDLVVLVCDQGPGSFVVGVGRDDGVVRWKTPRPEALSGHVTPIVVRPAEGPAQILAPGSFRMDAYAADTGESVWWVNGLPSEMKSVPVLSGDIVYVSGFNTPENDPGRQVKIPTFAEALASQDRDHNRLLSVEEVTDERTKRYFPFTDLDGDKSIDAEEWRIYAATMAAENGLLAFQVGGRGDRTATSLRWKYQRSVPQLPSPLLYRDVLYMINDGGVLTTLDPATGALRKQGRLRGAVDHYYASPVAADGKVYFVSQAGIVTVVKAGPEQEVLSVGELDDEVYATPAIADDRLYVRTRSGLYCFGVK